MIWGADNRTSFDDQDFATGRARAIGLLIIPSGGFCTATNVGNNYLLTARHCIDGSPAQDFIFRPAFTGPLTAAESARRPSIHGWRIVRGTGSDGKFSDSPPGLYFPGGDWALIEVDPLTYDPGTGGPGVPAFPLTWSAWPGIPIGSLPDPITPSITVASVGYSLDVYGNANTPSIHENCRLRRDGVCSAQRGEGEGIVVTDCEFNPGASGGPVMTGWPDRPWIVAINAGSGGQAACYNDNIGNRVVNANGVTTAPRNAGGLTFTRTADGSTLAVASDVSSLGLARSNTFDAPDGFHAQHAWAPFSDWTGQIAFGRLTSASGDPVYPTWIFSGGPTGIHYRYEASPNSWSSWSRWSAGSAMSDGTAIDVEATSTGPVAMQLYTLHGDGTIRTRRFLNGLPFYGVPFYLWDNETVLTTVSGGRAVGVGVVQGFQQLFVIDPTHVTTMWETTAYSNTWTGLFDFTQGLPVGIDLRDIAVGLDAGGRMDVFVLLREASGALAVWERVKSTAVSGSSWNNWQRVIDAPAGATQVEVGPVVNGSPRLALVREGELLMRRPPQAQGTERWVPAYAPNPTPQSACPPADSATCQ